MKCPRSKSANHCLTELFSIYQNKHWTIRRRDDHIVFPSSHRIISKIDWFLACIPQFPNGVMKNIWKNTIIHISRANTFSLGSIFYRHQYLELCTNPKRIPKEILFLAHVGEFNVLFFYRSKTIFGGPKMSFQFSIWFFDPCLW